MPIIPDINVITIETKNNIILDFLNYFICLKPYVIPIPKESMLLDSASIKVLKNIFITSYYFMKMSIFGENKINNIDINFICE